MKKIISIMFLSVLIFAGCSNTAVSGDIATELTEPVTIELWHPFTGDVETSLQEMTDEFNTSNDMVTVNLTYQGSYNDLYSKLQASNSSNTLPTMSFAYSSWENLRDSFSDLSGYQGAGDTELNFDNFITPYVDEVTAEDGAIYGVPFNKSTEVVFYNKDLAQEAGITEVPTTLEELFTDAQKITDATDVTGIGFDSLSNYLANSMDSCGLEGWQDAEGNFEFNDECNVANIQLYKDAIDAGYARTAGEDLYMSGPFGNGDTAMFVGSTAGTSYVETGVDGKFEWGAFPLPTEKVVQQGTNLVIYNTATPEEKLAAWEYIDFLISDENMVSFAEATGYLPVTTSSLNSDEYQTYIDANEVAKAAADSTDKMEVGVPTSFFGANEIYSTNFTSEMSSILDAGEDVETVMEELNEQAKNIYDRNNA